MLSPYVPGATVDVGQAFRRHSVYGGREEVDCAAVYQDFVCGRRRGKREIDENYELRITKA